MKDKFVFNKYNTDLDKKLRRLRGDDSPQKLVRVVIAVTIIVITAIIIVIAVKNKAQEVKQDIVNDMPTVDFNPNQIKEDIKSGVGSAAEDIKNTISGGLSDLLSK